MRWNPNIYPTHQNSSIALHMNTIKPCTTEPRQRMTIAPRSVLRERHNVSRSCTYCAVLEDALSGILPDGEGVHFCLSKTVGLLASAKSDSSGTGWLALKCKARPETDVILLTYYFRPFCSTELLGC